MTRTVNATRALKDRRLRARKHVYRRAARLASAGLAAFAFIYHFATL